MSESVSVSPTHEPLVTTQFKRIKPVLKSVSTQTVSDSSNQTEDITLTMATKLIALFTEVLLKVFEINDTTSFVTEVFQITQARLGSEHVNFNRLNSILLSLVPVVVS